MNRGQKNVAFRDNQEWNSNYRKWLGYETKRVAFGSGFVLKEYVLTTSRIADVVPVLIVK